MPKNQSTLTGAAGEYFIMYRLLRMGYIAALAPKGVPNADLIVTNTEGELTAAIQVKTRNNTGADRGWHMKVKHEKLKSKNLFYCFVEFKDSGEFPTVYVIPSKIVAETIMEAHKIWLSAPGRGGSVHKHTDMRRFLPDYKRTMHIDNYFTQKHTEGWLETYKENWMILNLEHHL